MTVEKDSRSHPPGRADLYISVIGAGNASDGLCALAEGVGRAVAGLGAILVCGGGSGVMTAAAKGAKESGGRTLGILPGHDRTAANPYIDYVVTTGMGHARNLAVVSTGDAVIAVGGEGGTLSEIGLALALGRPVVVLSGWRLQHEGPAVAGPLYASTPNEAVALVSSALGLTEA